MPDIKEDLDVDINPDDLRIDTYRSSGAGGQHINKTSSAIRITHIPTGIVVQCQNERSQFQNKDKAMQMLKAKLFMLKKQENAANLSDIRGDVAENGWGSQIRSYVLQPYTMVKDHRTNEESGNVSAVLDGGLDSFISAYLRWIRLGGNWTIGSGVCEVLEENQKQIADYVGQEIQVKYILDLRDFPGTAIENKVIHDFSVIAEDQEIQIVVETMGGLNPAYPFVKSCLEAGTRLWWQLMAQNFWRSPGKGR